MVKSISFIASLLLLAGACGDDQVTPDAGNTPDAPQQPDAPVADAPVADAPPPPIPPAVWVQGDSVENNRYQVVRHIHGETLPITPSVTFPGGATGNIAAAISGTGDGSYAPFDISPDGSTIAYAADVTQAGRFDLYVAASDGSNPVVAVTMPAGATGVERVRFSPDGARIAFRADYDVAGQTDVYVVAADATDATPTRLSPARDAGAADPTVLDAVDIVWSNDATQVIMTGQFTDAGYLELWIADATAVTPTPVALVDRARIMSTEIGDRGVIGPVFMTVHDRVVFKSRMDADNARKIHVVNRDGNNLEILPNSPITRADDSIADIGSIGLSTNGEQLALAADETALAYEIFVMPSDGSAAPTRVTSGTVATSRNPSLFVPLWWSADNTRIAFVADYATNEKFEPYVLSVAGGGETKLATVGDAGNANQDARELAWTPDGNTLYMIADHLVDNDDELFTLDANTSDQTPVTAFDVVTNGDLRGVRVTAGPPVM